MMVCESAGSEVEGVHVYQAGSQSRNAVQQEVKEAADLCPDGMQPCVIKTCGSVSKLRRRLGPISCP